MDVGGSRDIAHDSVAPWDWLWQPQGFKEKTLLCFADVGKSL